MSVTYSVYTYYNEWQHTLDWDYVSVFIDGTQVGLLE